MATTTATIDEYLSRLRDLAGGTNHIDRFYLFMNDDHLRNLEDELANSDQAETFYDRLLEQYRAWKDALTPDQWNEVVTYNDSLNGANQNALLDEL